MKLNPNAQKWVEALRSGKYQQGTGCLRREDKFCCLGVATDVAIENGVPLTWQTHADDRPAHRLISLLVGKWLGLKDGHGAADWELANRNDRGDTFRQIADYIEQHADELFVQEAQ